MKTKLGINILILVLLLLSARTTEAAKNESASVEIAKYEMRLRKVEQRLEKIDAPIQQMGPETADVFESGIDDVQMSLDEVNERLAMVRFVMSRDGSAPQATRDLAYAELKFMEADVADLEEESSTLSNEVDDVVWY
jgi:hypothetical protein